MAFSEIKPVARWVSLKRTEWRSHILCMLVACAKVTSRAIGVTALALMAGAFAPVSDPGPATSPPGAAESIALENQSGGSTLVFIWRKSIGEYGYNANINIDGGAAGPVPNGGLIRVRVAPGERHIEIKREYDHTWLEFSLYVPAGSVRFIELGPQSPYAIPLLGGGVMLMPQKRSDTGRFCDIHLCASVRTEYAPGSPEGG